MDSVAIRQRGEDLIEPLVHAVDSLDWKEFECDKDNNVTYYETTISASEPILSAQKGLASKPDVSGSSNSGSSKSSKGRGLLRFRSQKGLRRMVKAETVVEASMDEIMSYLNLDTTERISRTWKLIDERLEAGEVMTMVYPYNKKYSHPNLPVCTVKRLSYNIHHKQRCFTVLDYCDIHVQTNGEPCGVRVMCSIRNTQFNHVEKAAAYPWQKSLKESVLNERTGYVVRKYEGDSEKSVLSFVVSAGLGDAGKARLKELQELCGSVRGIRKFFHSVGSLGRIVFCNKRKSGRKLRASLKDQNPSLIHRMKVNEGIRKSGRLRGTSLSTVNEDGSTSCPRPSRKEVKANYRNLRQRVGNEFVEKRVKDQVEAEVGKVNATTLLINEQLKKGKQLALLDQERRAKAEEQARQYQEELKRLKEDHKRLQEMASSLQNAAMKGGSGSEANSTSGTSSGGPRDLTTDRLQLILKAVGMKQNELEWLEMSHSENFNGFLVAENKLEETEELYYKYMFMEDKLQMKIKEKRREIADLIRKFKRKNKKTLQSNKSGGNKKKIDTTGLNPMQALMAQIQARKKDSDEAAVSKPNPQKESVPAIKVVMKPATSGTTGPPPPPPPPPPSNGPPPPNAPPPPVNCPPPPPPPPGGLPPPPGLPSSGVCSQGSKVKVPSANATSDLFAAIRARGKKNEEKAEQTNEAEPKEKLIIPGLAKKRWELGFLLACCANVRKNLTKAEGEIEMWTKRKDSAAERAEVLTRRECEWREQEKAKNIIALQTMRSLIPMDIRKLKVEEIQEEAKKNNVFYPREFATFLKESRRLWWLTMHTEDIAKENFLTGMHKHQFVNLGECDVTELRALSMIIPDKFALDKSGEKAEWRRNFMELVKSRVEQENGGFVHGGFDEEKGQRALVPLPPLPSHQKRKPIYAYPTVEKFNANLSKLKQMEKRQTDRLERIEQIESVDLPEAIENVNNILADYRAFVNPHMKAAMGKEFSDQLTNFKNEALQKKKDLQKEVVGLKKKATLFNVDAAKRMSSKEYEEEGEIIKQSKFVVKRLMVKTKAMIAICRAFQLAENSDGVLLSMAKWKASYYYAKEISESNKANNNHVENDEDIDKTPVRIPGAFDPQPKIKKQERGGIAKKLTPEEEALERKKDLQKAMAKRGAGNTGEPQGKLSRQGLNRSLRSSKKRISSLARQSLKRRSSSSVETSKESRPVSINAKKDFSPNTIAEKLQTIQAPRSNLVNSLFKEMIFKENQAEEKKHETDEGERASGAPLDLKNILPKKFVNQILHDEDSTVDELDDIEEEHRSEQSDEEESETTENSQNMLNVEQKKTDNSIVNQKSSSSKLRRRSSSVKRRSSKANSKKVLSNKARTKKMRDAKHRAASRKALKSRRMMKRHSSGFDSGETNAAFMKEFERLNPGLKMDSVFLEPECPDDLMNELKGRLKSIQV